MKNLMKKKTSTLKKYYIILKTTLIILFWTLTLQTGHAQYSNSSNTNPSTHKIGSNRARVIFFNDDESNHKNENFYVSFGKQNNWWNNVKLEVQREGGVSARNGMFMDRSHLYLVADWDNIGNREDIVFGFNGNRRSTIQEKMRLTDQGRLGIGTSNPKGKLHLKHSSTSYDGSGFILENNTSSSVYNIINSNNNLFIGFNNNRNSNFPQNSYQHRFFIKSNGNIGIGTTDPKEKLHVNGNSFLKGNFQLFANEGENKSGTAYIQGRDKSGSSNIGLQLRSQKMGNIINALKINPDGNIGVGTTAPSEKLEIQGNLKTGIEHNILLQQGTLSDNKGLYLIGDRDNTSESEDIIFGFDGNSRESIQEKMRLTDEGYLGIGTNVPTEKLEVLGKIKANSFVTSLQSFPDYVFDEDYKLQPLTEIKKYVEMHQHLPGMPSEKEIIKKGLDLKEITVLSVEKIEELYLYTIKQQEVIKEQEEINTKLQLLMSFQQEITHKQELMIKKLEQRIVQLEKTK
ncbi:hypothetical protein [Aquimarina aggregata]|uniref:hypothetical protein n=1 Tax=Aquimarina aggregata TaxID=1642818 RepID=UPI00249001DF|nr:hypothetical protein [Aquimarina aggregata]